MQSANARRQDDEALTRACEDAGLTERQQLAVIAFYRGRSFHDVSNELKLGIDTMERAFGVGLRKLSRFWSPQKARCAELSEVLRCLRNTDIQDWEVGLAAAPLQ